MSIINLKLNLQKLYETNLEIIKFNKTFIEKKEKFLQNAFLKFDKKFDEYLKLVSLKEKNLDINSLKKADNSLSIAKLKNINFNIKFDCDAQKNILAQNKALLSHYENLLFLTYNFYQNNFENYSNLEKENIILTMQININYYFLLIKSEAIKQNEYIDEAILYLKTIKRFLKNIKLQKIENEIQGKIFKPNGMIEKLLKEENKSNKKNLSNDEYNIDEILEEMQNENTSRTIINLTNFIEQNFENNQNFNQI